MIYYGVNDYRNYLAHYGVKGMRWGHRKQVSHSGRQNQQSYQSYDGKKRKSFSTKKKVAIGVGVVAGILVAGYAYRHININKAKQLQLGKEIFTRYNEAKKVSNATNLLPTLVKAPELPKIDVSTSIPKSSINTAKTVVNKVPVKTTPIKTVNNMNFRVVDDYTQSLINSNNEKLKDWEKYFK